MEVDRLQKKKFIGLLICIMVCVPLLAAFTSSVSAASSVFGQTVKGGSAAWQAPDVMVGSRFTASSDGAVSSISVNLLNPTDTSDTAKAAIYSESSKQLVAVTEEKAVAAWTNGWVTFNFGSGASVWSGSSYSLVVWFAGWRCSVWYSSGSGGQSWYATRAYTGSFPSGPYSSFAGYGQENTVYSIYATLGSTSAQPQTSSPPSTNLEPFPNAWGDYSRGYGVTFSSTIPPSQPQITALDYGVLYNGQPTIRIDRYVSGSENIAREVDGNWLPVRPGDHIVFSSWMKTSQSSSGYNGVAGYGARIGFTYFDRNFIKDIQYYGPYTPNPTHQQIVDNFVPWNTATWTLKTLDFVVPSTVYDDNGVAHTPTGIIPWMQATTITDGGSAYFANPTLYMNP